MLALPKEDDVIAGKYRVERIVGRGGMGIVVAAWHLELDQRVALKFLMPELVERGESAERFRREARAAARIKSEHVVRVLDVGNWEGNAPYMVMEFLDGRDLSAELRENGTLSPKDCVDYLLQAIEAVAEAHSLGIVHRDLKPENLFLTRRADGSRAVKVLDFGISKTIVLGSSDEQSLTRTSNIMGSPFYMSPEQMRTPRNVDARSDIWALGAIIYDLLAGRPPYVAETIPQLCTMLLETDPVSLREVRPDVSEELDRVVMRCLAKSTADRWGSVSELAMALAPHGSRSSRVHVDRARRVLSASGGVPGDPESLLSSDAPPAGDVPKRPSATPGGGVGTATQASGSGPISPPPDSATQDSWGRTRPGNEGTTGALGARSTRTALVVGAAVLVLGAATVFVLRGGSSSTAATNDTAPVLVGPKDPPVPAATANPPPAEEALPHGMPSTEPTPSASAAAKPDTRTEGSKPVVPSQDFAGRKPPAPAASQRPKPAASGLTDFGGRR